MCVCVFVCAYVCVCVCMSTCTLREKTTHSFIPRLLKTDNPMKLYGITPQVVVRGRAEAYLKHATLGPWREDTKLDQRARNFFHTRVGYPDNARYRQRRGQAELKPATLGPWREDTKLGQRAREYVIRVLATQIMPDTVNDVGPQKPGCSKCATSKSVVYLSEVC